MTGTGPPANAIPSTRPETADVPSDATYGEFERGTVVGRGGTATVTAATHPADPEREVALKEPHQSLVGAEGVAERFEREAATWAELSDHPHVVTLHAWDTDPHPWLALEYVDGGSLRERRGESLERGLWTGTCVAAALERANRAGVAHLDLTPTNVLFRATPGDDWPLPAVADWGLAQVLDDEARPLEGLSPRYAAPEQLAPDRVDAPSPATDVYQLGAVLYDRLVGEPPYDAPLGTLRDAVLAEPPPPASGRNPALPPAVDDLLDRALATDPGDRYDSMRAFRRALAELFADRTGVDDEGSVAGPTDVDLSSARPTDEADGPDSAETTPTAGPTYDRALDLAAQGFVQLGEAYFARRDPAPPLAAWRRGVTFADARAGRAVERAVPEGDEADTDHESTLADHVVGELHEGTDHVVLGPPGSGKSTVCKRVACAWFDRGHGPVFYRESGDVDRFDDPDALARHVTAAAGHALVVVEDAVRPGARAVFDLLERVRDVDDVAVLLDAREGEWRDAGSTGDGFGTDPVTAGREAVAPVHVPRPDASELDRFVAAVEDATDRTLDVDREGLLAEVRSEAASAADEEGTRPGELFHLLHRLTALADDPLRDGEPATTLREDVADVHERLAAQGDAALDVGVCANVLNAAGLGVHPELLHGAAADEPLAAADAIEVLDGRVVFPREADWREGDREYATVHEAWSTAFLEHLLEEAGEDAARERFGRVVEGVLSLADEPARRDRVAGALEGAAPLLSHIAADPAGWADDAVEALHALGRERPKLAPLFGDGETDSFDLPDACSERTVAGRPVALGRLFQAGGYYDRAERAFERLADTRPALAVERLLGLATVAEERGEFDDAVDYAERALDVVEDVDEDRRAVRARAQLQLGSALSNRGAFDEASAHLEAALDGFEAVGDRRRLATALNTVGIAAAHRSDYDRARENLRRSLELARELGDRRSVANTLNNLGEVARHRGDLAAAREHQQQGLAIRRQLGDRRGEARSLNNLGIVASVQAEFERAREYLEQSLAIKTELGDRQGESNTRSNLAALLRDLGEYDRARESFERCLDLDREVGYRRGEMSTIDNLGELARLRGRYERARTRHERALDIAREIEFRYGEATSLTNLGELDRREGDGTAAAERFEQSLSIAEEIGEPQMVGLNQLRLGRLAVEEGDHEAAADLLAAASESYETVDRPLDRTKVRIASARLALARGDLEAAAEHAETARGTFAEMGATHWRGRARRVQGRIAAAGGRPSDAREHWRAALERFRTVDAPQDTLTTLQDLYRAAEGVGDEDRADDLARRASDLLADAPRTVAHRHREWVDRALGESARG